MSINDNQIEAMIRKHILREVGSRHQRPVFSVSKQLGKFLKTHEEEVLSGENHDLWVFRNKWDLWGIVFPLKELNAHNIPKVFIKFVNQLEDKGNENRRI